MNLMHVGRTPLRSYLTAGMGAEEEEHTHTFRDYWYSHCFWDEEKQQTTAKITNNDSHTDHLKSPTKRHFSNSKQKCNQRQRAVTVIIFPLHRGIYVTSFSQTLIMIKLSLMQSSGHTHICIYIYIYIYHIYIYVYMYTCTHIHIMQTLTWWAK